MIEPVASKLVPEDGAGPLPEPVASGGAPRPPRTHEALERSHVDAESALAHVQALYADGVQTLHAALREALAQRAAGVRTPLPRARAFYPRVRLQARG